MRFNLFMIYKNIHIYNCISKYKKYIELLYTIRVFNKKVRIFIVVKIVLDSEIRRYFELSTMYHLLTFSLYATSQILSP